MTTTDPLAEHCARLSTWVRAYRAWQRLDGSMPQPPPVEDVQQLLDDHGALLLALRDARDGRAGAVADQDPDVPVEIPREAVEAAFAAYDRQDTHSKALGDALAAAARPVFLAGVRYGAKVATEASRQAILDSQLTAYAKGIEMARYQLDRVLAAAGPGAAEPRRITYSLLTELAAEVGKPAEGCKVRTAGDLADDPRSTT